jgi:hypothetical protein
MPRSTGKMGRGRKKRADTKLPLLMSCHLRTIHLSNSTGQINSRAPSELKEATQGEKWMTCELMDKMVERMDRVRKVRHG